MRMSIHASGVALKCASQSSRKGEATVKVGFRKEFDAACSGAMA
jgi:hypothetical protein